MTLLEELQESTATYSPTVVSDLIDSNRARYGCVKPDTKKILFFMMKRIVLRGAIAFFNINKNRNNDVYYEIDDLVNELYMTLDNCANRFDTSKGKDFYLYFNSAVSKRVSRMANYKRVNNMEISFSKFDGQGGDEDDDRYRGIADNVAIMDFNDGVFWDDLNSIGLNAKQTALVQSLNDVDKKREILRENGLNRAKYLEEMEGIQEIISTNYINGSGEKY